LARTPPIVVIPSGGYRQLSRLKGRDVSLLQKQQSRLVPV